jgi:hypothetical protein
MIVKRASIATKGFLSPEIDSVRRQLRAELAASVAEAEVISDRVTACLFSADVSHYAPHETLALSFWIRCLGACQGSLLLAERGMAPESLILLRSAFEFLFFGAASLADPDVFESLAEGHDFERGKQARAMINEGAQNGHLTEHQVALLREVEEEVGTPKAALSAFAAAQRAGLGYLYASAYRGLSMMASHATMGGTDSVLEEQSDGSAKAVFGPSERKVGFALGLIARCLELGEERFMPLLSRSAAEAGQSASKCAGIDGAADIRENLRTHTMVNERIVAALRPWMQVDTWHTSHPLDRKRFHVALQEVFAAVGTSISTEDMVGAMKELGRRLGRAAHDEQYFGPLIERLAEQAEVIGWYLSDTATR